MYFQVGISFQVMGFFSWAMEMLATRQSIQRRSRDLRMIMIFIEDGKIGKIIQLAEVGLKAE
jgi:hypothetical protein